MLRQLISRVTGGAGRRPAGGGVGRRRGGAGAVGGTGTSGNGDVARGVEQAAKGFLRKRR